MAVTPDPDIEVEEIEWNPVVIGPSTAPAEMEPPVDPAIFDDLCEQVALNE